MKFRKFVMLAVAILSSLMLTTPGIASEFNFAVTLKRQKNQIDKQRRILIYYWLLTKRIP